MKNSVKVMAFMFLCSIGTTVNAAESMLSNEPINGSIAISFGDGIIEELSENDNRLIASGGSITYKYKKNGETYKICKDQDGYYVTLPGGDHASYGNGYSLGDVESTYDLKGVSKSKSSSSGSCR